MISMRKNILRACKINLECVFLRKPWHVEMSPGENPVFTFSRMGWKRWKDTGIAELAMHRPFHRSWLRSLQSPTVIDPWHVRKKLFAITETEPEKALSFLREFGLWRYRRSEEVDYYEQFPSTWTTECEGEPVPIAFNDLIYQRNFFEGAVRYGPSEWERLTRRTGRDKRADEDDLDAGLRASKELVYLFGGNFFGPKVNLAITEETLYPHPVPARITCYEIQDALRATVLIDWMEGREWPQCPMCNEYFRRISKRPMKYCTPRCSSRARQADWRKKHRNA
jgi:hypothetical protein